MAHANTAVIDIIQDLDLGFFRQLTGEGNTAWQEATTALGPRTAFMGAPCKPTDDEATTRGQVAALAGSPRSAYCIALLGPNEPNDTDYPWGGADNLVKHMWWIRDEAEANAWPHRPGGVRPPVWGPALRRNFSGALDPTGHRYDDDIAAAAAATYDPGTGDVTLNDILEGIDHHQYDGDNSPGDRVNGLDTYGAVPPSLVAQLAAAPDGKCSRVDFEIGLAQQLAPDADVEARSEFGHEIHGGDTTHALYDQETFLRCYQRGIYACVYEVIDEGPSNPNGSGNWFGLYNLTDGPKPAYPLVKALCGYTSPGTSIAGKIWFEPTTHDPDHGQVICSKTSGGWDVYILWEARTSTDLVLAPGHHVVGRARTSKDSFGNKHYLVNKGSDTMTVLNISASGGLLGTPEWILV